MTLMITWVICLLLVSLGQWWTIPGLILCILDFRGRQKEASLHEDLYPMIMKMSVYNRWRYYRRFQHSACQRQNLMVIFGKDAKNYYYGCGYRWWHILPSATKKPKLFFSKRYWYVFCGEHTDQIRKRYERKN